MLHATVCTQTQTRVRGLTALWADSSATVLQHSAARITSKRLSALALSTLLLVHVQTPEAQKNAAAAVIVNRGESRAPWSRSTDARVHAELVWHRWHGFILVFHALAKQRCTFLFLSVAWLRPLADALSWQSWTGSALSWQITRNQLVTKLALVPRSCAQTCIVLTGAIPTVALYRRLRHSSLPLLGALSTPRAASLLWAGSGLQYASAEIQGLVFTLIWVIIKLGSADAAQLYAQTKILGL